MGDSMSRQMLLAIVVGACVLPAAASGARDPRSLPNARPLAVSRLQLVFDDEFAGPTLDLKRWEPYNSPGNGGHGLRSPSAFGFDGRGDLVVTAQMSNGVLVSGGMASRLNQTYGYYEFRVRTEADPTGTISGVVLTWPQSGQWPTDGETDMYETQDGGGHTPFRSFVHFGSDNQQHYTTHEADGAKWHVIGMAWSPDSITLYRDGVRVWRTTDPKAIPHVPQHVCIQLDATSNGTLNGPVRMYVDYVRVWRWRTPPPLLRH
jgi:beta-glucanase (GH16 family)